MILVENMHVVMKKDIIQGKCASLGWQTLAIIEQWPGNHGNGVKTHMMSISAKSSMQVAYSKVHIS